MVSIEGETDELKHLIARRDLPDEMDRQVLMATFTELTGLPEYGAAAGVSEDAFLAIVGEARLELEIRPGGWTVNLGKGLASAAMASAVVVGVMWAAGFDQLPLLVLPAVLPIIADVERARLSRKDKELLLQLRANAGAAAGHAVHPDVLYHRLPAAVRDDVNRLDFQDFLANLIESGIADDAGYGDVKLRAADQPAWIRINFR